MCVYQFFLLFVKYICLSRISDKSPIMIISVIAVDEMWLPKLFSAKIIMWSYFLWEGNSAFTSMFLINTASYQVHLLFMTFHWADVVLIKTGQKPAQLSETEI